MLCVAEHVTSNSGMRSDALHSTSENFENFETVIFVEYKAPLLLTFSLI